MPTPRLKHMLLLLPLLFAFGSVMGQCMTVTTSTTPSSCTSPTGTATATVTGGVLPIVYAWNTIPAQTGQTVTGLGTLVYTVTVTDGTGCVIVANADVDNTGTAQLTSLTLNQPLCNGQNSGTLTATGSPGSLVGWRTPGLTPGNSVSNIPPGTYTVGAGDIFSGCVDSVRFTIIDPPLVQLAPLVTQTSCGLNNGSIDANGSGGTSTLNYAWSNGQTTQTAIGLAPGSYTVTMTDQNGCNTNTSATVNASSSPSLSLSSSSPAQCFGSATATATVAASGGTPGYTYDWSNGQTGPTLSNVIAGTYTVTVTDGATCTATLPVTLGQPAAALSATVSTVPVGCGPGASGSATATPAGGTTGYTYLWSDGQTTQTATNLAVGPYSVTVTDANACTTTASGSVTATAPPTVTASISGPNSFCAGSTGVQVSAVGAGGAPTYTYSWTCQNGPCNISNAAATNPTVTPTSSQYYYVQVTDQNNCSSNLDSVFITVLPIPVANAGPNATICSGDTLQLNGSATGAGPAYTYSWTPATGLSATNIANPLAFPLFTTTYILNVASNGCTGTPDTMTLTVNPVPSINFGNGFSTCFANQATLTATSAGANPVTFTWTANGNVISANGPGNITVTNTVTTLYGVTAVSANGCTSATDTATISVIPYPQAEAGPDRSICGTDTVTLAGGYTFLPGDTLINTSGITYSWSPATGLSATNVPQPLAFPGSSTTYTLSVSNQGCTSISTVNVDVFTQPVAVASATDSSFCDTQDAQLSSAGSSGTTFNWSPATLVSNASAPNPMAFPNDTTTFTLIVSNGICADTATVTLNVQTTPDASFFPTDTVICRGQIISFINTSTDANDLFWDFGDGVTDTSNGNPQHAYLNQGSYVVTLSTIGEGGCADQAQFTVTVLRGPNAIFETDPEIGVQLTFPAPQVNFTSTTEDVVAWHWTFGDDSTAGGPEAVHIFQAPGVFQNELLVIDAEGCRDSVRIPLVILDGTVEEFNMFSPNGDGINDVFRIGYNGTREYTVAIFDRWGRQIFLTKDRMMGWDGKNAAGQDLPEGVYYYTLWVGPDVHSSGNITLLR
jgi:gliding motility-associated-like protein